MSKPFALKIFLFVLCLVAGIACQSTIKPDNSGDVSRYALNNVVALTFGPNGKLWRLTPTEETVYLDYSTDYGHSFSPPVAVNEQPQDINVWPENPPYVVISRSGRINVLYYANEAQSATNFFTYSDDGGRSFSPPVRMSDHADTARHYMDKMLIDQQDKLYIFWHDMRHQQVDRALGSSVLSLYYTARHEAENSPFTNRFITGAICSCCRTAVAFDNQDQLVILARQVFPGSIRDHALIHLNAVTNKHETRRVSFDQWQIEACPEHGPALTVDEHNRSHMVWFTLGDERQGLFYAYSDNFGQTISEPVAIGDHHRLAGHPDVISLHQRVILTWKEFDGDRTLIQMQQSSDSGQNWSAVKTVYTSAEENGYPRLLSDSRDIYLTWYNADKGLQITKL